MKKTILFAIALSTAATAHAQSRTRVDGYTRSNGTYVQPYERTTPNQTRNDNWSTQGNVNPYTGQAGTRPRDEDTPNYRQNDPYRPR